MASRDCTPALADADRELLGSTLRGLRRVIGDRGAAEQLLHGEPHPGNVLTTKSGLLFIDLEACCRGPGVWWTNSRLCWAVVAGRAIFPQSRNW